MALPLLNDEFVEVGRPYSAAKIDERHSATNARIAVGVRVVERVTLLAGTGCCELLER